MIADASFYQGAVFAMAADRLVGPISIRRVYRKLAGFYLINEKLPVYVKYSRSRKGPWHFTFQHDQQKILNELLDQYGSFAVFFVCGTDGIAAIELDEFRKLLDTNIEAQEAVTVRRGLNKMYGLKGRDGELDRKVSRENFVRILSQIVSS